MSDRHRETWEEESAKKLYEFFCLAIIRCTELAREFRFDKTHKWHMNLVSLYGSILELSHAISISVGSDSPIGVPILLRSQLEAFVDFTNLASDRKYGYNMDAAHLNEWIKILREAKPGGNPYLKGMSEALDLDAILGSYEGQVEKLRADGYRPLNNFEKFERSGQAQEYRSFYNFLCCHSHNNIRALIERHVAILADGADIEVQFFPAVTLAELVQYFDSAVGILIGATKVIHEALESPRLADVELLAEKLSDLRKPWTD